MGLLDLIFPKYCVGCKKLGDFICPDCFTQISFDVEFICLVCNRAAINGVTHPSCIGRYTINGCLASISYKRITKRLVSAFKYQPYLSALEHILTDLFYEGLIQQEQFHRLLQINSILVPIPLHPAKYRERGYNQAEILAKNLGKRLGLPVHPLLQRVKKTQTQVSLKREERKVNIKDAFIVDHSLFGKLFNYVKIEPRKTAFDAVNVVSNVTMKQFNNKESRKVASKKTERSKDISDTKQIILIDDVITSGATMLEAANVLKRNGVRKVWGIALSHGQ